MMFILKQNVYIGKLLAPEMIPLNLHHAAKESSLMLLVMALLLLEQNWYALHFPKDLHDLINFCAVIVDMLMSEFSFVCMVDGVNIC